MPSFHLLPNLLLPAAMLLAAPLGAQDAPAGSFNDEVEVSLVNVDVVVTDRDGNPVHGLAREDFLLLEDGRPAELTNFFAVGDQRSAAEPEAGGGADAAGGAATEPSPAEPVTMVFFFDNSQTTAVHRNRVLDDLRSFVTGSGSAAARFMVVAYNPGIELVAPLTADRDSVVAALDRVEAMPASGLQGERERQTSRDHVIAIWQNIEDSKGYGPAEGDPGPGNRRWKESASGQGTRGRFFDPCLEGWGPMLNVIDAAAEREVHRAEASRTALLELTRALAGVPGRKFVLHLSDGIPQVPGMLEYDILGQLCPDRAHELYSYSSRFDQSGGLEEIVALANLNRTTFYALDTAGLSSLATASAEADDLRFTPTFQVEADHRENLRASLHTMADGTGGRAFFDTNRPHAELESMAQDLTNYYSLGFTPRRGWDGEVHELKVKLAMEDRKGYRLRYRDRYRALPETERQGERTLAALVLGLEENPLGIEVRTGAAEGGADGAMVVPVEILLPVATLTGEPQGDSIRCELRLVVAVQDAKGDRMAPRERLFPLVLPADAAGAGRHSLVIRLPLAPGSNTVAFGVEDRISGVGSYLRRAIEVTPEAG